MLCLQKQTLKKIDSLIETGVLVECGPEPAELSLDDSVALKYWRCRGILLYETNAIVLALSGDMWCYQAALVGSTGLELDDLGAPTSGPVLI